MIKKMAKLPPAFTRTGNVKKVEKAKAAYEKLGWIVIEEFIGSLSNPPYLIVEGDYDLQHPKRPIIDKIEELDAKLSRRNKRLTELQEQITNLNLIDTSLIGKEINRLPDLLTEDEQVLGAVAAIMDGAKWLIVSTKQRVIMLDEGALVRSRHKEVQLQDITSIEMRRGLMNAEIEIMANASSLKIKKALPSDAENFVAAVKTAMAEIRSAAQTTSELKPESTDDPVSQIGKLSDLMEAGAISEEEFSEAKTRILGKL